MQNNFASEVGRSLLPDFEFHPGSFEVSLDRSKVDPLQEDQTGLFNRANLAVQSGRITVAATKKMVGIKPDPEDDVYLRSPAVIEVPIGTTVADIQLDTQLLLSVNRTVSKQRRIG